MANPKRKHSRMRTSKRRAHWKLFASNYNACPQCKEPKLPHRVCTSCGFYNNQMIMAVRRKKKKKEGASQGE
ncbi:MAG: 50S ribosomal protein L32 [bacterium]